MGTLGDREPSSSTPMSKYPGLPCPGISFEKAQMASRNLVVVRGRARPLDPVGFGRGQDFLNLFRGQHGGETKLWQRESQSFPFCQFKLDQRPRWICFLDL